METELERRYEDLRDDLTELQRAANIEAAQLRQENADLRRQLDEVDAISKAQAGVALRSDGVPFIHIDDVRRSYARLHKVLNASINDALIMDCAADEIESLRRQVDELQLRLNGYEQYRSLVPGLFVEVTHPGVIKADDVDFYDYPEE